MKRFYGFIKVLTFILLSFSIFSCQKKGIIGEITKMEGNILVGFSHLHDGKSLLFDTMIYSTSSGNQYMINDLQYFISAFSIHNTNGKWIEIASAKGIHYIDARDKSTFLWKVSDGIPPGKYDSVNFIFGLDETGNISFRFPDPPERDMFWPEILGGGYHYMKMDLKWKNNSMTIPAPFMFHLGIGQMYKGDSINTDSIIGYIQNWFSIRTFSSFIVSEKKIMQINVTMNVEKWFDAQNAFNFSDYPMGIMQDQSGMFRACMNGRKAFDIK